VNAYFRRDETTVVWSVVPIVVFTIKIQTALITVCKRPLDECGSGALPLFAHVDAAASIVAILRMVLIEAPTFHVFPNTVEGSIYLAMPVSVVARTGISFEQKFCTQTAARLSGPAFKITQSGDHHGPAAASYRNEPLAMMIPSDFAKHGQPAKVRSWKAFSLRA
jgi:hypothetical protein